VGWSLTLGVVGETLGSLIQAQWFSHATWTLHGGPVTLALPQLLAIIAIVAAWLTNILGIRVAAAVNRVISVSFVIFVVLVLIVPVFAGGWHLSKLSWHVGAHPVITMLVWMYAAAWTVYGTEICATFAPEYRNPQRDTFRAMKYSALFVFTCYVITPLSATGVLGETVIGNNPITYTVLLQKALGTGITDVVMIVIVAELLLSMIAASADGGRVIFGIARQGLTLREFDKLNRFGEPGRALTMDMLCTVFAVSGFLLLRKGSPRLAAADQAGQAVGLRGGRCAGRRHRDHRGRRVLSAGGRIRFDAQRADRDRGPARVARPVRDPPGRTRSRAAGPARGGVRCRSRRRGPRGLPPPRCAERGSHRCRCGESRPRRVRQGVRQLVPGRRPAPCRRRRSRGRARR
jgi:hypothetical protein